MAIHSSILAWRIPWTEEPGRLYSPGGSKKSDITERLKTLSQIRRKQFSYGALNPCNNGAGEKWVAFRII